MSRKTRFGKRARLLCETLEDRCVLDVSFGFEQVGTNLYFRIDGDDTHNDVFIFNDFFAGDVFFEISYVADPSAPAEIQYTGGYVSVGEISLALAAAPAGTKWGGFHIVTAGDDDHINAGGLLYHGAWIEADGGNNGVVGSQRNDKITTGDGVDAIDGQGGADVIDAGGGSDFVQGGNGADDIRGGPDALGGFDDDLLIGGNHNDTIRGGGGFDWIDGGAGKDELYGGTQSDVVRADYTDTVIDGGTGGEETTLRKDAATNIPSNVPNHAVIANPNGFLAGDFSSGDWLRFDSTGGTNGGAVPYFNNTFERITGSTGHDHIDSTGFVAGGDFAGGGVVANLGTGDDTFIGSSKNDAVNGQGGSDTISHSTAVNPVTVTLLGVQFATGADIGTDALANFENIIGGAGGDTLVGSLGANKIDGRGGDDGITGLDGNDTLGGGVGNDTVDGGNGDDVLDGGDGDDEVNGAAGADTIRLNFAVLNMADNFRGGGGVDTYKFYNVPMGKGGNGVFDDAGGELAGDDIVTAGDYSTMFKYLDDISDLNQGDWDATQDVLGNPNRLGLPPIFAIG